MLRFIKLNPAAVTAAVVALVNFLIAYGVHLSQDQAASIGTIAAGLLTIIAVATTRPVSLQLLVGSVTTITGALGAFHFHLTPDQISTGATVLTLVLGVIFHLAHTPVAAVSKRTTANALQGVRSAS